MIGGSPSTDREALVRLSQTTNSTSWYPHRGWNVDRDITRWVDVTLNTERRVTKLYLSLNNLRGFIPKELGDLQALEVLKMANNHLTGQLPKELGNLRTLRTLDLRGNQLSGIIPKELGNLQSIVHLDLSGNQLTGGIPTSLAKLRTLGVLELERNAISEVSVGFLRELRKRPSFKTFLNVAGNPLVRPPQTIMEMGVGQAIAWWKDIERSGEGTSNKLKMVFVGLAEAGKTTVVRNITGQAVPKVLDRTVGIEITEGWKPVDGGPLEISIWDFAGQADYYASHQIFLTKGSLFLLVVDLRALFMEASSGIEKDADPQGRVYRWLEMLHLRVPGAAVALVGTHADSAEFANPAELEKGLNILEQLVARYKEDKEKEIAKADALRQNVLGQKEENDARNREELLDRQIPPPRYPALLRSFLTAITDFVEDRAEPIGKGRTGRQRPPLGPPGPLFIHDKVFTTSLHRDSTRELGEWVGKAAMLLDCPAGFNFPAVGAATPQIWIDANMAMDSLREGGSGKRYVSWREAVETFGVFLEETKGNRIPDYEDVLLRAMRHREAEGGVLLSLEHDPPRLGESSGMLYLDPTWLIEVIRRLTDHTLVGTAKDGTLKTELEKYGEEHNPPLEFDTLWARHRSYQTSGTLDLDYLRFLWLHRHLDGDLELNLNLDEFNSVLATMEALLVLYRVKGTTPALFVVPARLPEYGDEQVLENGNMALGDAVVRTRCSFRQSYAPPGLIGRFLAFANAHIKEARECWQHGAHVIWTPGSHDVLVYETQFVETSDSGSVAYPGLVICVKGSTPAVREVLDSLAEEVRNLFKDKVHGYPGLRSVVFEGTDVVPVSALTSDLREYLENRFDYLGALVERVAGVASEVLQAFYLAAEKENQYPRLLILKPDIASQSKSGARKQASSPTVRDTRGYEGNGPEGAATTAATAEGMQRETWDKWVNALKEGRTFRMIFICEHDLTEVKCGPGGNGYLIEDLPTWIKGCLPLLQVSFYALRVAVGMVSHVDLPLDDLLAALVNSASSELLGAMGTRISVPLPGLTEATPLPNGSTKADQPPQRLQKEGYAALGQFMQKVESPPSSCCGLRSSRCSSCGFTRRDGCDCVNWRDEMVRVRNGKGGVVWVKQANAAAYKEKSSR